MDALSEKLKAFNKEPKNQIEMKSTLTEVKMHSKESTVDWMVQGNRSVSQKTEEGESLPLK